MNTQGSPEVARFFSQARRIPMLVGKLPDGTRIWGGPYTIYQILAVLVTASGMYLFRSQWSSGAILSDLLVGAVLVACVGLLAGQIPLDARNPFVLVGGFGNALQAPRMGTYRGRRVRLRKPHQPRISVSVQPLPREMDDEVAAPRQVESATASERVAPTPEASASEEEATSPKPQNSPAETKLPQTGLDRLLAQAAAPNPRK